MKIKTLFGILLSGLITTSFATTLNAQPAEYFINKMRINAAAPTPTSGIEPGMGYSSDTQNLAPAVCYAPTSYRRGSQSGTVNFSSNMSVEQIANSFGLQISLSGGFGEFAANGMSSYLRSMQEDAYSLSLNYYQKVSSNMHVDYSYSLPSLLNEQGTNIYNNGKNQLFRIICGDTLVTDYDEGAGLIMTLKITFRSKMEKDEFSLKAGANFGSILNASVNISQIASRYNLDGTIIISSYQLGGDPTQLSKLLSNQIVECDIKNVTACQQTAQALIDYAANDFPQQFSMNGGIWAGPLVPLGGFTATYTLPDIGIPLPPTYVTPAVKEARDNLVKQKINNMIYFEGLAQLAPPNDEQIYPVPLDTNFKRQLHAALVNSSANLNIFVENNSQVINCWLTPVHCPDIANSIINQLRPVTLPANFDQVFDHMRASAPDEMYATFWPTGAGYCSNEYSCKIYYQEYTPPQMQEGFALINSYDAMAMGKSNIRGDGFVAHGLFHDAGTCPYTAGYTIVNQTLTTGAGGCAHDRTEPYALEIKDNPFYFKINQ